MNDRDRRLLGRAKQTLRDNVLQPCSEEESRRLWELHGKDVGWCARPPDQAGLPLPWHPRRGICPSPFRYRGVWNWDAGFHALGAARFDPGLARDQVFIMLDHQLPSGGLPDVIFENGRIVTTFGKPPVLPWCAMRVDQLAPDDGFLRSVYPAFLRLEEFWRRERGGDADGLFHYDSAETDPARRSVDAGLESGWDDSVRWDEGCNRLWPIDLNCYMVMLYRSMDAIAGRLGLAADQARWQQAGRRLADAVNDRLVDPSTGIPMDRFRASHRFSRVLTPASLMPLFAGIASQESAARLATLAGDPSVFFPGMPSVAYGDAAFESSRFWRGPTWLNVAWFALRGLKSYGYAEVAEKSREVILGWCAANEDALWEYYDSRTGKGTGAPQFGWTAAFVTELILEWE